MNQKRDLVIGLDFGSDSVRALLVNAVNGEELSSAVKYYPRWKKGLFCDPKENRFRQHPLDYVETMEKTIRTVLAGIPGAAARVAGIGVDTTGSTPVLADASGCPLSLTPGFEEEPDAMFILWKDHTSIAEAAEINSLARSWGGEDYTRFVGGIYSSEWFWAKVLRVVKTNPRVAQAAVTILEHCDWIPALLTGVSRPQDIRRSRCAAGHKAMWHPLFGPYPSDQFLQKLHPTLPALADSLGESTLTSDVSAGKLTPEWATRLGLDTEVVVAVGAFDAHMGAVGGGVVEGTFLRIMGTSTCDIMVGQRPSRPEDEKLIRGICGQVDGSVIPGYLGYEAGQSAYGDIFAWFRRLLAWPVHQLQAKGELDEKTAEAIDHAIIPLLDAGARLIPAETNPVLALDWLNGRRTPDADQRLTGALTGLSLGTDAPSVYRALVEAAAYGSRAIVERFREEGITVKRVAAIGGVAKKSDFVMQTLSNVLNMEIAVARSEQACALGAGIFAAVAGGLYTDVLSAQDAMASSPEKTYRPDPEAARLYDGLYARYRRLGAFVESETDARA